MNTLSGEVTIDGKGVTRWQARLVGNYSDFNDYHCVVFSKNSAGEMTFAEFMVRGESSLNPPESLVARVLAEASMRLKPINEVTVNA